MRTLDFIGHYQGTEFSVFLPNAVSSPHVAFPELLVNPREENTCTNVVRTEAPMLGLKIFSLCHCCNKI